MHASFLTEISIKYPYYKGEIQKGKGKTLRLLARNTPDLRLFTNLKAFKSILNFSENKFPFKIEFPSGNNGKPRCMHSRLVAYHHSLFMRISSRVVGFESYPTHTKRK